MVALPVAERHTALMASLSRPAAWARSISAALRSLTDRWVFCWPGCEGRLWMVAGGAGGAATPSSSHARICSPSSTPGLRSEEHTSELQSREILVCRLLLDKR